MSTDADIDTALVDLLANNLPVVQQHEPQKMLGRAVVVKPGDVLVIEIEREMSGAAMDRFAAVLSSGAEKLGIRVLVLPAGCKVARVWIDGAELAPTPPGATG
jgi:hypothetical protein